MTCSLFTIQQYSIFNGFSGQTLYESWTMSCFNVIFTFLPPMAIGIFDQFASARLLDKYPQMYILGQKNEFFNHAGPLRIDLHDIQDFRDRNKG